VNDKKENEQIGEDLFPLMNGKPLDFIPFIFIGIDDTTPSVDEPPLIDIADVNIAHYRLDADHKHGLHYIDKNLLFIVGSIRNGVLCVKKILTTKCRVPHQ